MSVKSFKMNIYTASEAELATLPKIGNDTAKKLVNLRNEVRHGMQKPLTPKDLAEVRLKESEWQENVDQGKIKLDLPPDYIEKGASGGAKLKQGEPVTQSYVQSQMTTMADYLNQAHANALQQMDAKFEQRLGEINGKF